MQIDGEDEGEAERAQLAEEIAKLRAENERLLALNNKLFSTLATKK